MPNIRCKTCGRTYSYEKQGMCPKCGAYNRPPRRERVDPDGSVHYLDDRSAITGVVPNHPRDKVCFEEKVCYEEQAKKPSFRDVEHIAASIFPKMANKKRGSEIGIVIAVLVFALSLINTIDFTPRQPEPDYPISEPVYPAEQSDYLSNVYVGDDVVTYEYNSDYWPDYDGSGCCWPGQRFELMGMWPYVSSLSVEDDVLIATVQYFPDDAIAPDLVVTLDDNSTITIPCFDAEYPFTYDLSLLSEEERYHAVLYTLDFPDAYHAGGITAPTGDVIRVDVSEVLY